MDHGIGYALSIGIAGFVLTVGGLTRLVTGLARARRMRRVADANPCRGGAECELEGVPSRRGRSESGAKRAGHDS